MNLKGFKKVSEDDQKAVLQNHHGHSITIAKKSLPKQHLEALSKLSLHSAGGNYIPSPGGDENATDAESGEPIVASNRTPEAAQFDRDFTSPESQHEGGG